MLTCPMCKKSVRRPARECPSCRTDLSLLVNYVEDLQEGLVRAEALTRAGELGEAVWAYLAVLEVDPDNAVARRQVGQVATAVRQFDEEAPGRLWGKRVRKQARRRSGEGGWLGMAFWAFVIVFALLLGYALGSWHGNPPPAGGEQKTATE